MDFCKVDSDGIFAILLGAVPLSLSKNVHSLHPLSAQIIPYSIRGEQAAAERRKGGEAAVKLMIEGSPKEIAALAAELQERQISITMAPMTIPSADFQQRIQKLNTCKEGDAG